MRHLYAYILVWFLIVPDYYVPVLPGRGDLGYKVGKWKVVGEYATELDCERLRVFSIGASCGTGGYEGARVF